MKKQLTMGRLLCYFLCLTAALAAVLGVSYARYSSQVSGSTGASVAAAVLGQTSSQAIDVSGLKPGDSRDFSVQVLNFSAGKVSEVEQEYTITVKTQGNLPLTVSLKAENADAPAGNLKEENGVWKTVLPGSLPAAVATTHAYTLTISWPAADRAADYAGEIDALTLEIDAQQVLSSDS